MELITKYDAPSLWYAWIGIGYCVIVLVAALWYNHKHKNNETKN